MGPMARVPSKFGETGDNVILVPSNFYDFFFLLEALQLLISGWAAPGPKWCGMDAVSGFNSGK